jgi:HAD superfamily hydrolase (TIGR01490 family)
VDYFFFDLDHTLIDIDCEWAWKNMLVDMGVAPESHRGRQDRYMELHAQGKTPIEEYVDFLMRDFTGKPVGEMAQLAMKNFEIRIRDKVFPDAVAEIRKVKAAGGRPVLLSGSFRPIVEPVAAYLEISEIVSSELEVAGGKFTGALASEFCIREGKLNRARDYCAVHDRQLDEVGFFGDSLSDLQIFEQVGQANVVNPGPELARIARRNDWRIVNWKRS